MGKSILHINRIHGQYSLRYGNIKNKPDYIQGIKETIAKERGKISALVKRFKNLLGTGPHLLLLGILFEGFTRAMQQWVSFHIPLTLKMQVILTVPCITLCLLGLIWFHHSLNLIKVYLKDGERMLITNGPFDYVRHPLYSTLLITFPPLMIIWLSDLLFFIPWVLLFILSHYVVSVEERGLIKVFGESYKKYQGFVPALLPYKGAGGKRYREHYDEFNMKNL